MPKMFDTVGVDNICTVNCEEKWLGHRWSNGVQSVQPICDTIAVCVEFTW